MSIYFVPITVKIPLKFPKIQLCYVCIMFISILSCPFLWVFRGPYVDTGLYWSNGLCLYYSLQFFFMSFLLLFLRGVDNRCYGLTFYTLPITQRWLARRLLILTIDESTLEAAFLCLMSCWRRFCPIWSIAILRLVVKRDWSSPAAP